MVAYQGNWFGTALGVANLHQKLIAMENITLPHSETQIVVDLLVKRLGRCTIFAFGYSNNTTSVSNLLSTQVNSGATRHHFDHLVFSSKASPNGASNIANALAEQTGKTITVSVLLHKVD